MDFFVYFSIWYFTTGLIFAVTCLVLTEDIGDRKRDARYWITQFPLLVIIWLYVFLTLISVWMRSE